MQELQVKEKGNKKYIEYRGVVLQVKHSCRQQHGAYDFFDMNPGALSGGSEIADIFEIVLTYYLSRGGEQQRAVGKVTL